MGIFYCLFVIRSGVRYRNLGGIEREYVRILVIFNLDFSIVLEELWVISGYLI